MTTGRVLAVGAGPDDWPLAIALHQDDVERCEDAAAAVRRAAALRRAGTVVDLAVIGPAVPRPLTVASDLRRDDPRLGLLLVAAADQVATVGTNLAFVPSINDAVVLSADLPAEELREAVRRARRQHVRRREVRHALDLINEDLLATEARSAPLQRRDRVSERYLAALTRHAPDPILSVDVDGRIVACNDAATEVLGIELSEVERTPLVGFAAPAHRDRLAGMLADAAAGRPQRQSLVRLSRCDGEPLTASVTAAPVDDGELVVGVVVIVHDVTEQLRTAQRLQELQKAESLATLAGGVAHDFNNLLTTVAGWTDIALEDVDDHDTVVMALERVREATGRAAELARQMLAYSGRGRFELEPVDVAGLVRGMGGLLRSSVARKVAVELRTGEVRLPPVMADPTQLRQVLLNLVVNASEAIGDEEGTITVRLGLVAFGPEQGGDPPEPLDPGRYVELCVEDTGPGMDAGTLGRVFDPFFTTKFTGRGLGLAATQGIVHAHGGAIQVDSVPGGGSRFRVLLPPADPVP